MVALQAYPTDVATYAEPELLRAYDEVIPRLDAALARLAPAR